MVFSKDKLQELANSQKKNSGNKVHVETLGMYLGVKPRPHYPELKGIDGKTLKDEEGRDRRSEVSDGDTYTLSELGTSKMILVVADSGQLLEIGSVYNIMGIGHDIRSANMYFLDELGSVDELMEE